MEQRIAPEAFEGTPLRVARQLLGQLLVRRLDDGTRISGIIVEVEAYLARGDSASHSFRGPGQKNASMFMPAGTLYVYPIHSRCCLNVVTEAAGVGSAVLVRGLEPWEGLERMADQRAAAGRGTTPLARARELTTGPGRLCQALQVSRELDGIDLLASRQVWIESAPGVTAGTSWSIRSSGRIGVSTAQQRRLRWFCDGNHFVSGCAREHSAGRWWSFRPVTSPAADWLNGVFSNRA